MGMLTQIAGLDATGIRHPRRKTYGVNVGQVRVGGGAPVVVQSMTNTDTADAPGTAQQCIELAEAGSELVRVTVNVPEAAAAVPEIKKRMLAVAQRRIVLADGSKLGRVEVARLCDIASPGAIAVSNAVRELCMGKRLSFSSLGQFDLKGFTESVPVFAVHVGPTTGSTPLPAEGQPGAVPS